MAFFFANKYVTMEIRLFLKGFDIIMAEEKKYTLSDFDYDLPEALIAQTPLKQRDASRLLALNAKTGGYEDKHFYDILDYLNPGCYCHE